MRVLVPFDARDPNTRLAPVLDDESRQTFAAVMRDDVVATVDAAGHKPEILSTEPINTEWPVRVDDRPLSAAINAVLAETADPLAVVMADLALVTRESLDALFEPTADIVIVPGLGGGTNAIVIRDDSFRVDYHGSSYRKHRAEADQCGATVETVDSFRLAVDIDEPDDLVEVLLHGRGAAPSWLRTAGFGLDTTDGRCALQTPTGGEG